MKQPSDLTSSDDLASRLCRAAMQVAWTGAVLLGLRIVYGVCKLMLLRIDYPFELEWMEGGMLLHVWQVLQGKPLYGEPSPEFMPFLYTPGYTYVSALFAKVFGVRLFTLRMVSLLATLANVAMLARLVHIETRNVLACFAACALFIGTFKLSGGWLDLARVDSLAIAFTLGSILTARLARTNLGFAAAGLLAAAAFMTKQTQLVALPGVLLWSAVRGRVPAIRAAATTFFLATLVCFAALQRQSHGWFWYYVVELPATHGTKGREMLVDGFFRDEIAANLPLASAIAVVFLFGFPLALDRTPRVLHGLFASSLIVVSYASRLHMGSSFNDLIPAHVGLALLFGLALRGIVAPGASASVQARQSLTAGALACAQLALLSGGLHDFAPTAADEAAGNQLVKFVHDFRGEVLVVNHPHIALLAGKKPYAHQMAYIDVYEADRDPRGVRKMLDAEWQALLAGRRFSAIILDSDWYVFMQQLERGYKPRGNVPIPPNTLFPTTGTMTRPDLVYVPKRKTG